MLNKELFTKFLSNECSKEEFQLVCGYLDEHPELIEEWMPASEFTQVEFEKNAIPQTAKRLSEHITRKTYKSGIFSHVTKKWMAAAALIFVAGFGLKIVWKNNFSNSAVAVTEIKHKIIKKTIWKNITSSHRKLSIRLPDHSTVELFPFSSIYYDNLFGLNAKRNVFLSGKAFFKVAKDKAKPFAVFTGDIVTTAIGTSFSINAIQTLAIISVRLQEGKVSVKSAGIGEKNLQIEKYLQPGDELVYNKKTKHGFVKRFDKMNSIPIFENTTRSPVIYKPDWYRFDAQQLADVLDQLSYYYQVPIEYKPADISRNLMTAKFNVTDSLEKMLHDIATLNHLVVKKVNGKYVFKKLQH